MKITQSRERLEKIHADALAVFLFEGEKPTDVVEKLDKATSGAISEIIKIGDFRGKLYETTSIYTHGKVATTRILLVGLGKKRNFDSRLARNTAGAVAKAAIKVKAKKLAVYLSNGVGAEEAIEGVGIADYDPGLYKTKKDTSEITNLILIGNANKQTLKHSGNVAKSINWVRKLISEPANIMTPAKMVEEARIISKQYRMGLEVIDEKEAEKRGMGAFVGIAKGSEEPSFMISLTYKAGSKKTLAVVGKGITFDSGGISLKPSEKMHEMKMDMSGAATVLGLMSLVGQMKPAINVVGVAPLTENLPGGRALKPGDVLKAFNGKTMEILNTDAEGRVVLADALSYAAKLGATHIVDLATLTGAVIVALGSEATGILGRPRGWLDQINKASEAAGERVWELPLYPEHKELLRSDIADVANTPPRRGAGVIAGAAFLQEFVPEKIPWVHMDIAGTAWLGADKPYMVKGPTGVGVRTLIKLIEGLEKEN